MLEVVSAALDIPYAALADALCQVDDPPEGLSHLLRLVTTYAPEVPTSYVAEAPPGVRRAAEAAAAPGVRAAAAGLVAALAEPREVG